MAGFYSSLFDNMYAICGKDLKIECFCLPEKIINPSWSGFVSDVYENYKNTRANLLFSTKLHDYFSLARIFLSLIIHIFCLYVLI